jgi:hypothetical protein
MFFSLPVLGGWCLRRRWASDVPHNSRSVRQRSVDFQRCALRALSANSRMTSCECVSNELPTLHPLFPACWRLAGSSLGRRGFPADARAVCGLWSARLLHCHRCYRAEHQGVARLRLSLHRCWPHTRQSVARRYARAIKIAMLPDAAAVQVVITEGVLACARCTVVSIQFSRRAAARIFPTARPSTHRAKAAAGMHVGNTQHRRSASAMRY